MPVLFGDKREDGLIRVWRTQHRIADVSGGPTREILEGDMGKFPDGYWFEKLPEDSPEPEVGKDHIMYFDPATGEFIWEEQERPLTPEEIAQDRIPILEQKIAALEGTMNTLNSKVSALEKARE